MDKLQVIKVGGRLLDDEALLAGFVKDFSQLDGPKILVHGGGQQANNLSHELGLKPQAIDGRRITDASTLRVVVMTYAGLLNTQLVAQLQASGCAAVGLSGADGNTIFAHKRKHGKVDYGFAGDIDAVNTDFLSSLLTQGMVPVICPITHDGAGQLLNTNADTIATEVAAAFAKTRHVKLRYCFDKPGVLANPADETSVFARLSREMVVALRQQNMIHAGMLPKLDNAFAACERGVSEGSIGPWSLATQGTIIES
jgi:acetylglutamate kinase